MPYDTFRRDDRYCNYKIDSDGNPVGDRIACFDTRSEAREQVEALYAQEGSKGLVQSEPVQASLVIKKDASGRSRWIASFSNNIRDSDNPPEILSGEAHRRFAYMVDKGIVPPPEAWIYHEDAWRVGETDWMAVDERDGYTFIMASGYFYDYAEDVALALSNEKDVALSHGMYPHLIEREDADQSIITGYVSKEITFLPRDVAANKLTAYASMENKSMVKDEKRRSLAQKWPNLGEDLLARIEASNEAAKSVAEELDLETKEQNEEPEMEEETKEQEEETQETEAKEQEETTEETKEETKEETEVESKGQTPVSYAEIAEVLKAIGERLESIEDGQKKRSEKLEERLDALEGKEKAREKASRVNGLVDFLSSNSAVGKEETKVDGRTKLGKDGPEENKEQTDGLLFFEQYLQ